MNPWKGLNTLPRNMWIIFFTTLINRTGTMVLPFLTLYLTTKEKLSAGDAGLVIAFYGAGALVTAPLSGKLSDKIGPLLQMKLAHHCEYVLQCQHISYFFPDSLPHDSQQKSYPACGREYARCNFLAAPTV